MKKPFLFQIVNKDTIYHYVAKGTRESHPSVHDLQSTTRLVIIHVHPNQIKYSIKTYAAMALLFRKPFQRPPKRLFVLQ